jgi:hypothetical protein
MPPGFEVIPGFFISACCAASAYFITKKKDPTLEDTIHAIFWFAGALWWFFNGMALSFWNIFPDFARTIIFFGGVWLGIHYGSAFPYIFTKISKKRIVYIISITLGIIFFLLYYFLFLVRAQEVMRLGSSTEVYYTVPENVPQGHIFGPIIGIGILLSLAILFINFKKGIVSIYNLTPLYPLFALLFYAAITFPGVLYVEIGFWMHALHIFVPYLIYLGYVKKEK